MKSFRLFILLLIFGYFPAFSQVDSAFSQKVLIPFENYVVQHPYEKVYLHFDRPYYNIGDTIWFKAYTVVGQSHQLSALSGVLNVELINNNDSVVRRLILPLVSGVAWGEFTLSRSYKPGIYRVRAYTNWMRNDGPDYFFNRQFLIGGISAKTALTNVHFDSIPDVQFFPEGGDLVNGVRSKVAVKVLNSSGLSEDVSGVIIDNQGTEVAVFSTQHLGMGVFAIMPQSGKTYFAKLKRANGAEFKVVLPRARDDGYTLAINNSRNDSIAVKIAVNSNFFNQKKDDVFYVAAQSNGKVYYYTKGKLKGLVYIGNIDKERFPSGIVQFTLFSQSGEPLNERIAFIQNEDTLKMDIPIATLNFKNRQKMKFDLTTKDVGNVGVRGSFSVAVTNESRIPVDEIGESNIFNNLLLSSELKGDIEKPNYYFTNVSDKTKADLDVLMLTQGYRRFEWKSMTAMNKQSPVYQPQRSLEIAGVLKTPSGHPVSKGKVTLVVNSQNLLRDTTTDLNGNFKFDNLYIPDTTRVILRARKENNGKNLNIYVKQADYPDVDKRKSTAGKYAVGAISPQLNAALQNQYADYQKQHKSDSLQSLTKLKEVTIQDKKRPKPDQYNGYGARLEYLVNMKKLRTEFITAFEGLQWSVPGMSYLGDTLRYERHPVRIIIDDISIANHSALKTYSVKEIDNIRIVDSSIKGASVYITTKRYAGTDTASTALKEVIIKGKKNAKAPDMSNSANLHGGGNADQVIMGDKIGGCITLSDCLQGKVFGVRFEQDGTPVNMRMVRSEQEAAAARMVVIIDGTHLPGNALNSVNANDVYSIEVLRSAFAKSIYGGDIGGGALIITTKRGTGASYVTSENPTGLITYPFKGFSKVRKFYSPKYDSEIKINKEDFRTTIFWNPNIVTDKDGKASFEYFNADTKGTYRIVIEGIDDEGNLGRKVIRYKVD